MPFFTDEVLAAVEIGAGVLVLGIVLRDGGIAMVTPGTGVIGLAGHGDQAFLPGFVLDVSGDASSDKAVGAFAQVGLFRLVEAFFELGQDDEFGALFEGVIDDLSRYFMGVVVGDAGYFFIIFRIFFSDVSSSLFQWRIENGQWRILEQNAFGILIGFPTFGIP